MRTHPLPLLVLAALSLGADPVTKTGGTISGTVVVAKDHQTIARDDVYVYLLPVRRIAAARKPPGQGQKKEIRQKDKMFIPKVLVVPVGTTVAFPNYDDEEHNVFSPTEPGFDLKRYKTDHVGPSHTFEDPDEFRIYCDVHQSMEAWVKVVDTPYIQNVVNGKFSFQNVPPGTYKVVAWVHDSPESKWPEKLVVTNGKTIELSAPLNLQLVIRSGCHQRKDGTRYEKYTKCPEHD